MTNHWKQNKIMNCGLRLFCHSVMILRVAIFDCLCVFVPLFLNIDINQDLGRISKFERFDNDQFDLRGFWPFTEL